MNGKPERFLSPLAMAEMEVLEEGREWMRQRLERKLQEASDAEGDFSPCDPGSSVPHTQASDCPDNEHGTS